LEGKTELTVRDVVCFAKIKAARSATSAAAATA
jgi:hypothetical protein